MVWSGSAQFKVSFCTSGTHSLTAVYTGTLYYAGSTSAVLSQVVLPRSQSYVVCLDCGKQFEYDLKEMRIGKLIDHWHDACVVPKPTSLPTTTKVKYALLTVVPAAVVLAVVLKAKKQTATPQGGNANFGARDESGRRDGVRSDGRHAEPGDTGWSLCGARLSLDAQAAFTGPTGLNPWSHDPADRHSGLSPSIRLVPDGTNDACQCLATGPISSCGPSSPTRLFPAPREGAARAEAAARRAAHATFGPLVGHRRVALPVSLRRSAGAPAAATGSSDVVLFRRWSGPIEPAAGRKKVEQEHVTKAPAGLGQQARYNSCGLGFDF
jgi:hypothetical protein